MAKTGADASVRGEFKKAGTAEALQEALARRVGVLLECNRVVVRSVRGRGVEHGVEWQYDEDATSLTDVDGRVRITASYLELQSGRQVRNPLYITDTARSRHVRSFSRVLRQSGVRAYTLIPIYHAAVIIGAIECEWDAPYRVSRDQRFALLHTAEIAAPFLRLLISRREGTPAEQHYKDRLEQVRLRNRRLVEYGNLLIITTDTNFKVTDVLGDTESILGVTPRELIEDRSIWAKIVHPSDGRKLYRRLRRCARLPRELSEEICIVNRETVETRWLMLRAVPLYSQEEELLGWEGFVLDVTERHRSQEELVSERKRIEALYDVARTLQVVRDPAVVILRALNALVGASGSECGFGLHRNRQHGRLELVAAHGLSLEFLNEVENVVNRPESLVQRAVEQKEGLRREDITQDPHAAHALVNLESLKSTIVMPCIFEDTVYGVLVLYCREEKRYSEADYDLVAAASYQIGLAVRQAEQYAAEKQQTRVLTSLYRLTRELSKQVTLEDAALQAFRVIEEELGCRRMWLGVINEQATHLVGKAARGPGLQGALAEMQIELANRSDSLDEVLRTKKPVTIVDPQRTECPGFERLLAKLQLKTLHILPLISLGRVVGVMMVEPSSRPSYFSEVQLPLLSRMAREIASVIVTRRFEDKIADAEKMRMAGLLASGVAHNFNNVLQAVMGQASLIRMQAPDDSPQRNSAQMIVEAAGKGASLVTQLLSFSMESADEKKRVSVGALLVESRELYESALGEAARLSFELEPELPSVLISPNQIQQVVTNLVLNARDAIAVTGQRGEVRVRASRVQVKAEELSPELAPGEYVRIEVQDNGLGMDEEQQARCFEPFYTTKNSDVRTGVGMGSVGLGLSTAHSIVAQHQGTLIVRSERGAGSTFSVFLPTERSTSAVRDSDVDDDQVGVESPEVVLCGFPEAVCTSVRNVLHTLGLRAMVLDEPRSVVQYLQNARHTARMIVVEGDNPRLDAARFTRAVTRRAKNVLLAIAVEDPERIRETVSRYRGVEIAQKPLGVLAVHALVRKLYRSASPGGVSENVEISLEPRRPNGIPSRPRNRMKKPSGSKNV